MTIVIVICVAVVFGFKIMNIICFIWILEGIDKGSVKWFCNYNRNHLRGSQSIGIGIRIGNVIEFFICLEIYVFKSLTFKCPLFFLNL